MVRVDGINMVKGQEIMAIMVARGGENSMAVMVNMVVVTMVGTEKSMVVLVTKGVEMKVIVVIMVWVVANRVKEVIRAMPMVIKTTGITGETERDRNRREEPMVMEWEEYGTIKGEWLEIQEILLNH